VIPTPPAPLTIGDLLVRFPYDAATGRIGLELLPTSLADQTVAPRSGLAGLPYIDAIPGTGNPPARVLQSLVQIKLAGETYPGAFAQGHTMRDAPDSARFRFQGQERQVDGDRHTVTTLLSDPAGIQVWHELTWTTGDQAVTVRTTLSNRSSNPITVEMLSSFALGGITPFAADDAPGRLLTHRFRSGWSAEGRLESRTLEELHLERSWSGAGLFSERFGQVGTMPVRRWFPFAAVEDTVAGVTWGVQLAWAGSWQIEFCRQHDDLGLSGGLADREFGHWLKTLAPGASLTTPPAVLSCVQGDLDAVCDRLTATHSAAADRHPVIEHDLPVVFNEWCTTWGDPQHDRILAIADRLRGSDVRYLVIDAGWYKTPTGDWNDGHGDWQANARLFPEGLAATAAAIRARGLVPGLWFELETVGQNSAAFSLVDHLLQRDGRPVTVRGRRFWNLQDPAAIAYLSARVIDVLETGQFGYLKVDYNETLGLGADHPDGQGEGLRQQVEGIYAFFARIRERLPHLVIENCSSGGHRLEPSMLARTAMSSFSDAHELVEIPLIAGNLHRLLLPRQSQIWAVLHPTDDYRRLTYSLAATFLGRMCLSGDITGLSAAQWALVHAALRLYRRAAPVIKHGTSRRHGVLGASWRHPTGWQAVVRAAGDGRLVLIVVHAFADAPRTVSVPLPAGTWQILDHLAAHGIQVDAEGLQVQIAGDFTAQIILLSRLG
jgi:alpha-galactosidase